MEKKMQYQTPEMILLAFHTQDIITNSSIIRTNGAVNLPLDPAEKD